MKKLFVAGLFLALTFSAASMVEASEGQTILTNRVGESSTCWVGSVVMANDNYTLLFSCRNITYPGGTEVFSYILWSNPANGGNPIKLGQVGFGKGEYKTNTAFTSLFVTKEPSSSVRTPSGTIIMQGNVQQLPLPSNGSNTAPTQTEAGVPTEAPVVTPQPRSGIAKFLTSGILAVLGIAGIIFVVFIITKR